MKKESLRKKKKFSLMKKKKLFQKKKIRIQIISNGIVDQAEEVEMSNEEDNANSEKNPANDLNDYLVEGDEVIEELLAQDIEDNT